MNYAKLPIGFAMALAQNENALAKYGAMTEPQKQAILNKAQQAGSNAEMHQLVASLAENTGRL